MPVFDEISSTFDAGCPVVIFRLPGKSMSEIWLQSSKRLQNFHSLKDLPDSKGFLFAPFIPTANNPILFLQPDYILEEKEIIPDSLFDGIPESTNQLENEEAVETDKQSYLQTLKNLIKIIRSGRAEKVVISRTTMAKRLSNRQLLQFHTSLCTAHPHAFVYLVHLPPFGMWMGASPEILISCNGKRCHTMALAGTRPAGSYNRWGEKELEEQAIVTRYIQEVIIGQNVQNLRVSEPFTSRSGQVEHLCTSFDFDLHNPKGLASLLQQLHPTPAVCGIPSEKAKQLISKYEPHGREYYTGFLGPINFNQKTELFVNLRCMKITSEQMILFSGGGITKDSVPEQEWKESTLKARTLLAVIEKIRNLAP